MKSTVTVYKTDGYNLQELKKIAADALSGFNFKGKKVLLKPNMLQAHLPEEGVTTHPIVVEAAASVIIRRGGKCAIGDSPSGHGRENAEKSAEKSGFMEVCRRLNIKFEFFDGAELRKIKIPEGQVYKKIYLPESFFTYDFILNLPKLKTHSLTVFTLGVKNMMGVVPGLGKVDFHVKAAHPVNFASAICDLYSVVTPDFTIVD
ncbi:MAG: DUF362 domain-containing protein, partial [Elusimicrobiota bacterium]|nr:DUF362 domain-containing protein [Elusimicrobiota bacterium]